MLYPIPSDVLMQKILQGSLMIRTKFQKLMENTRPHAEKIVFDTAKGYIFGCVFGIFASSRKPILRTMHENGKNFAKMSAAYTTTEIALEKLRNKHDVYNSMAAGAVSGALGSKQGAITGSYVFGTYSALSSYLNKKFQ